MNGKLRTLSDQTPKPWECQSRDALCQGPGSSSAQSKNGSSELFRGDNFRRGENTMKENCARNVLWLQARLATG
ncbi:hypothetical protein BaRGS_00038795 [Batillaria attramentaria]|uniref:Uncharacterized protein n=1 Tax=Batillaria attramentaria TaxID=370345 RepID=A0ABD0J5R7_9CAEN